MGDLLKTTEEKKIKNSFDKIVPTMFEVLVSKNAKQKTDKAILSAAKESQILESFAFAELSFKEESSYGYTGLWKINKNSYLRFSIYQGRKYVEPLILQKGIALKDIKERMDSFSCQVCNYCTSTSSGGCFNDTGADEIPQQGFSSQRLDPLLPEKPFIDDLVSAMKEIISLSYSAEEMPINRKALDKTLLSFDEKISIRSIFSDSASNMSVVLGKKDGLTATLEIINEEANLLQKDGMDRKNLNEEIPVAVQTSNNGDMFITFR